jgi:hypothetical protein
LNDDDGLLDFVRDSFALDEQGRLVWRERPRHHFATARGHNGFNARAMLAPQLAGKSR